MVAVILAGGKGERFWPVTHEKFPKYRIRIDNKESLLQKTYNRLSKIYDRRDIYVVTTRSHRAIILEELKKLRPDRVFIEPSRNNTAPAIFLSLALLEKKYGPSEAVSFFPADQLIQNESFFKKTIQGAAALAKEKRFLVTIGVRPLFPATGYGYIEKGAPISGAASGYRVRRFVEKPSREKAARYLKSKNFLWNAGIFTWRIDVFREAMKKFAPAFGANLDLKHLEASYRKLPKISIDYALMEKADNVAVCQTQMDWCDMGNWDVFFEKSRAAARGAGGGPFYRHGTRNSFFINHHHKPIVALGVEDLIVVQTRRGTLICKKGRAEEAALLFKKLSTP
ncbi:MAG: mannose-1-phosphate guanylyltransferase [Candidatus Omnitrophica bacterium]|nr:mannose-1-phosphate guanylyltransferase [Candidatus Omnitrophota bacterium]